MALFELDISSSDGRADIGLSGEIDLSTVTAIQERLDSELTGEPDLIVFDLRQVGFLDSSGLRLLIQLNERQRAGGRRFVLIQGPRRVAKVFELTGVTDQIEIVEDPAQVSA